MSKSELKRINTLMEAENTKLKERLAVRTSQRDSLGEQARKYLAKNEALRKTLEEIIIYCKGWITQPNNMPFRTITGIALAALEEVSDNAEGDRR